MSSAPQMGLHRDMSFEDYLAVEAMSASGLREFARSPWHYRNRVNITPTRPMLRGSLAHCAQLEPDAVAARYAFVPDDAPRRPTAAQWNAAKPNESSQSAMAWWRDFEAGCDGRTIISAEEYGVTKQQIRALQADPYLREFFARGFGECSIFWVDKASGVYCKARPDWISPLDANTDRMGELKTTADESPDGFGRVLTRLGYHRARAHYISGWQHATGRKVAEYVFAAVTSAPPVLAVPYLLDEEDAQQAEDEYAELLGRFAWCQREDRWPTYGDGPQIVGLQKWAKRSNEVEIEYA